MGSNLVTILEVSDSEGKHRYLSESQSSGSFETLACLLCRLSPCWRRQTVRDELHQMGRTIEATNHRITACRPVLSQRRNRYSHIDTQWPSHRTPRLTVCLTTSIACQHQPWFTLSTPEICCRTAETMLMSYAQTCSSYCSYVLLFAQGHRPQLPWVREAQEISHNILSTLGLDRDVFLRSAHCAWLRWGLPCQLATRGPGQSPSKCYLSSRGYRNVRACLNICREIPISPFSRHCICKLVALLNSVRLV